MRKQFSQALSMLGDIAALSAVGLTLWYIFGDLPNPLPPEFLSELGVAAPIGRWLLGLFCYLGLGAVLTVIFSAASRIVLVGWSEFVAEEREKSAKAKQAAISQAGTLVAVSVESNGFLDSATSMVETTEGFYRVFGRVDVAVKGEQVIIQKDSSSIIGIEWLCFAGKKYQLTR